MRFSVSSPPPGGTAQKGRGDAAAVAGRPIIADETNSSSDFNQWLHAMKMVARLPGGMPPEFRRKLWLALADKYLKSKNVDWEKEEVKCFSEQWREDDEELGIQIVKDLHRTGSSLCSGPAGTINQAKLKRILLGYARFNPEVGYCQGFNMLGALILQVMDKEEIESIKVMIYLVEGILPSGYFSGSLGGLQADMAVFRELMTSKLPRLAKHLQKLQGPVENAFEPPLTNVFTMQWFLTMFCTCLPMTCVLRVWDLVLIEGSDVLLRTALVLWSLLEERILNARTADDFYCQMGSFSSELLNGHLVDSNGLIEKVVELGPIPELQKLRDKHLYNITPFRDKKGLQLYYSDEDGDSDEDSRMAVATAWGLRLRRGSAGLGSKTEGKDRIALDISLLKKQYDRLRERQRQAHIILTSAVARQGSNSNPTSMQMNQLLIGRNAIVTNNGRRLGPPQGAIPPARKPSLPTSKPPKLAQTKKLLSGETLHWRDTDLSKRRRESLKWKDIKSDSSQSGQDDRPATLVESAPSSRSSSSEPKSKRISMKASRQRSDSSSYSEESDGNSSTSTSLCDEDEIADHTLSSLEGSPMRKSKSSKKHSEVTKQKSLEDVLNSNDGKPTTDNQIPFIQLTTIESPVSNANKADIDTLEYSKEDSETESNRLDYAGFVDEFSWPEINEPTSSISLEDTTIDATSVEGDYLSLSNVITSTSQLSPIPDITTYINNSNISPLRTPISAFDYANLVVTMDDSKKFDVNEEGVTNKYFERVNIVERPTKLDLLYSLNEEDSIRNAYVSREPSPESSKEEPVLENLQVSESESSSTKVRKPSDEEVDRKMQVLLEYSNQSSLSFIAEAKHEISSGMFKEAEFDAESLKYQPTTLIPIKKANPVDSKTHIIDNTMNDVVLDAPIENNSKTISPSDSKAKKDVNSEFHVEKISEIQGNNSNTKKGDSDIPSFPEEISSSSTNFAQEKLETDSNAEAEEEENHECNIPLEEFMDPQLQSNIDYVGTDDSSNIPSTEDLETRFRALEMNFTGRKESLSNKVKHDSPTDQPLKNSNYSKKTVEEIDASAKKLSVTSNTKQDLAPDRENSNTVNEDIEPSKKNENTTATNLRDEKNFSFTNQMAEELKDGHESLDSSREDNGIPPLHEKELGVDDKYEPSLKTKENNGEDGSVSPKKGPLTNDDREEDALSQDQNLDSSCYPAAGDESIIEENTGDNKQLVVSHEEKEKLDPPSPEYVKKDLKPNNLISEHVNTLTKYKNQTETEEPIVTECTEEDEQPSSSKETIEQLPSSLSENLADKDLKATRPTPSTEDKIVISFNDNQAALEGTLDKNSAEDSNKSLIPEEITSEPNLSSPINRQSNKDLNSTHLQNKYQICGEELMKPEISGGEKQSSLEDKDDKQIFTPSPSEEWKPSENNYRQQNSASEELMETERVADEKEPSAYKEELQIQTPNKEPSNEVADRVDEQASDKVLNTNCQFLSVSDELEVNNQVAKNTNTSIVANDQDILSPSNKEESTTELTKTAHQHSKNLKSDSHSQIATDESVGKTKIADNNEESVPKEGELQSLAKENGVANPTDQSITHSTALSKEEHLTSTLKDISRKNINSDIGYQQNIEDTMVNNLSDDNKQSMLPKEEKSGLTTEKLSNEDILYYQHHSPNEDGSEIEGSNDPKPSEDHSSKERTDENFQVKDPVEMVTSEEKSIIQPKTDGLVINDFKDEDQREQCAMLTTTDQPLSTYSFSYTQDHFRDRVSLLSEVQSTVTAESSRAKLVSSALQSTVDLQHSLQGSIAVTTSVSVKNSASLKTSVSVKSSVSLKSSSLYDRERSLHVNTGVTVCEDPKETDLKMISSNELENSDRSKKESLQDLKPLDKTQDNAVTVSVVKSVLKDLQLENKSRISLSMQLSPYPNEQFGDKHLDAASILDRESSQSVDASTSENINKDPPVKELPKKNSGEGTEDHTDVKPVDQSQRQKSPYSQELDERFKALERRFSDRALPLSADSRMPTDQSDTKDKEPKKQQVVKLDAGDPRINASSSTEGVSKEEIIRAIPSTADLEHRFRELERKLSEKNINLSTETEEVHQKSNKASNQSNTNLKPSIVLSKNDSTSPVRLCDDSISKLKKLESNEDPSIEDESLATRKRIPSTEDLETRFEALEIQKSLRSPTNLLSPSKIKEDFLVSTPKSEIPSTEDLENRFQAFEQSKKVNRTKPPMQTNSEENALKTESGTENNSIQARTDKSKTTEGTDHAKTSTKDSERKYLNLKLQNSDNEPRTKTKDVPKVTFAEIEPLGHSKRFEEAYAETEETHTNRERVLRKVPSARDLEARFEALEKRKSFTGFSSKTQEYLLSEQNRNFLSSESLNSVESLKKREANDKKVASTEDLVLRLDALEQRMAITENCIKTKISTHTPDFPQDKKQFPSTLDLESRFEALEKRKSFTETSSKTKESNNVSKTVTSKDKFTTSDLPSTVTSSKEISQEMKLNLIKRSLFEDQEPVTKKLPSTQDLENRFDALEQQKTKSLNVKKKTSSGKNETKDKITAYEPTAKSTQNWEVLEYRRPNLSSYSKIKPSWEEESQSKLPSTKDLESRFEALEEQKSKIDRCSRMKDFQNRASNEKDLKSTFNLSMPKQQEIEKPQKDLASRSIDQVLEQICSKTKEIERQHQMTSKVPSTQDLEIRYHDLQINSKRGDNSDFENLQNLEQTTDSQELTGNHKRRDLYKLESQSDETLTATDPTNTEFETKTESRPTSCPEYRDPFNSNIVTTDRVLKIIEENSKILHRILKKTLADSGGIENAAQPANSRSGLTDSLLALGNIFPRSDESISPNRIRSQSRVRSTITFRSDDSSITDRLASIKSTIKSIDTLCEDQTFRKDKCQRYIDSLFTTRPTNATSPNPPVARPLIKVDDFESSSRHSQERVAMRELKKEASPRRRRDEDREEYESRVRRDMMPNSVDAPSEFSCSLENIEKVDSEVDRINQDKQVETQLERPLSPYYAPGYDLNNRSITPVVYIPTKLEIRHTTVTSTFYDRYLTEKHIERTFPRSKKHSPVSPTITKSYLDISKHASPNLDDRSSKSAENSPSRRKDGLSPNQTVSAADYKRSFISSLEVAQKDLHIRSCDNILLQLRSSTHNRDVVPSIMVYNPLPTKIRKPPELAISLGLYKDYGSDASSKS